MGLRVFGNYGLFLKWVYWFNVWKLGKVCDLFEIGGVRICYYYLYGGCGLG